MNTIYIDFTDIGDEEDFFAQLKTKMTLPDDFQGHETGLKDFIYENAGQPLHLEFVNMSVEQLEIFEDMLLMLEDAEEETSHFTFAYYLEQYEDEE